MSVAFGTTYGPFFLCAEGGGGGGAVVANRLAMARWELFDLQRQPNGKVAFRAANGQYLCAEGGGGGAVVANRNGVGPWEQFDWLAAP
jgi:hypothetical protein